MILALSIHIFGSPSLHNQVPISIIAGLFLQILLERKKVEIGVFLLQNSLLQVDPDPAIFLLLELKNPCQFSQIGRNNLYELAAIVGVRQDFQGAYAFEGHADMVAKKPLNTNLFLHTLSLLHPKVVKGALYLLEESVNFLNVIRRDVYLPHTPISLD